MMHVEIKAAQAAAQAELCLIDAIDNAQCALLKAQALIAMTYGEAGETFRDMNDGYQDCFLWAISDLIDEAKGSVKKIAEQRVTA